MAERGLPIIHAVRPWQSPDAGTNTRRCYDKQSDIDKCLICPRADCVDCLAGGVTGKTGRPAKTTVEDVNAYLVMGMTQKEICEILGITSRTLRNYKAKVRCEVYHG